MGDDLLGQGIEIVVQVREGYGTTETVTACCLTPPHMFKEGSIGLPFPDTYIKIVEPDTDREVPSMKLHLYFTICLA